MNRYLVEFDVINPDTEVVTTLYMTSGNQMPPFLPGDTDRPGQWYDPRITDLNGIARSMFQRGRTYGQSSLSGGVIKLNNADGGLDYLYEYGFSGRAIRVYVGDGQAFSDYTLYFAGVIDTLEFDYSSQTSGSVTLTVRSQKRLFEKDIQTAYYAGTNSGATGNEGESDSSIVNQLKPLCFGKCYNVTPVMCNAAGLRYQVHSGAIQAVTSVYANGVGLTPVYSSPPGAGQFYADLTTGIIELGTNPAGESITCDVQGAKFSGTYQDTVADIVYGLLTSYYGMSASDIDTSAFTILDSAAGYSVGIYLSGYQRPDEDDGPAYTYASVFDQLLDSIGSYWTYNNSNKFTVGQFNVPDAMTSIASFDAADIIDLQLVKNSDANSGVPLAILKVLANKNWTVQTSLAGSVSVARQEWLKNEYRVVYDNNADNATIYNADIAHMTRTTLLASTTDAATEAARLIAIYETSRKIFKFVIDQSISNTNMDIGACVTLTFNRFNLSAGKKFIILAIKNNYPQLNQMEIEVYG